MNLQNDKIEKIKQPIKEQTENLEQQRLAAIKYRPRATGSKIVVEIVQDETSKKAEKMGLFLPAKTSATDSQMTTYGTIVDIGSAAFSGFQSLDPNLKDVPWFKVGDLVCFVRYAGVVPPVPCDKNYRIMNDIDIYCKLEEVENADKSIRPTCCAETKPSAATARTTGKTTCCANKRK